MGGESSRPGAEPVTAAVELERVIPVVQALSNAAAERPGSRVRVSVDTVKPVVAAAALAAGATLLNDISASLYEVAAEAGTGAARTPSPSVRASAPEATRRRMVKRLVVMWTSSPVNTRRTSDRTGL